MSFTPEYVNIDGARNIFGGTAVVLDVIRAYTTAAWAFELGAERIVLTDDIDEALRLKAAIPGALAMKDSTPLPGFELSNSPVELQSHDLRAKTIVQRTTHGTVGAVAAREAGRIYCASFLTALETAWAITLSGAEEATFVVTGENGAAEEDRACAEYIAAVLELLNTSHAVNLDEPPSRVAKLILHDHAPYLARAAASNAARLVAQRAADGLPGVHPGDVEACLDINRFDFVMMAREELIEGWGPALVLRAYNLWDE